MYIDFIQFSSSNYWIKMSQAQKTTRIGTKPSTYHKKCKLKSYIRSETQRHKSRTWYMLGVDSNRTLFR